MKSINKSDIFNKETLNIFVDGSIHHYPNKTSLGCSGALSVITNDDGEQELINIVYDINPNSTNNETEINSVLLGVMHAISLSGLKPVVNIFSDSQFCIFGLREWIFKWFNNSVNGIIYNSSGEPVANQASFLSIIYLILNNNIKLNLYHQKGHVSNSRESLIHATDVFKRSNGITEYADYKLILEISKWNNMIDVETGEFLEYHIDKFNGHNIIDRNNTPFTISCADIDAKKYGELINSRIKK